MMSAGDDTHNENARALRNMAIDMAGADLGEEADDSAVVSQAIVELNTAAISLAKAAGVEWDGYSKNLGTLWCIVQNEEPPQGVLN